MTGAPIGREVGLYMDTVQRLAEGDVLVREGERPRAYRVLTVREQQRGMHEGRQHLRVLVIDPASITPDDTVVSFAWYPRRRRRP